LFDVNSKPHFSLEKWGFFGGKMYHLCPALNALDQKRKFHGQNATNCKKDGKWQKQS
jgi:hypothetical protein